MNDPVTTIFGLIGGLALFLFGMNSMSEALQKAAGERMKRILSLLTKNRIMGALAGLVVTAVLQSSSATTVMAIGFVSSGLMSLPQAISIIFGANIGTTMTAQLLAFKLSNYIYPIIFIGFMMFFTFKKEKIKNIGMVIFSFGLLFEGIEIMGGVMKPLAASPFFVDLMGKVTDVPVLGVLLGAGMTLVVQSSSATIAVLQNFASQPAADGVTSVIGLAGAIPILLGDNIGTTITALLASIGQSKDAKRTAIAHSIFNISGSIVFLFLIPVLISWVQFISPSGNEVDVISRQIANAHTTFNVVCTLVRLPLHGDMEKIVTTIIRGDDKRVAESYEPKFLDRNLLRQPAAAMYLVSQEIVHLSDQVWSLLMFTKDALAKKSGSIDEQTFLEKKKAVSHLRDAIASYITQLLTEGGLTEAQAEQTAGMLSITNNMSWVAQHCQEIHRVYGMRTEQRIFFSTEAAKELGQCMDTVSGLFNTAMNSIKSGNYANTNAASQTVSNMRSEQKAMEKAHVTRLKKKLCNASLAGDYVDILYEMDQAACNCLNIAVEAAAGQLSFADIMSHTDAAKTAGRGGAL